MAMMIGELWMPRGAVGGESALRAVLRKDLTWQCDDPEWATMLNAQFPGPAAGVNTAAAGRYLLYRAAERLSARVVLTASRRTPEPA